MKPILFITLLFVSIPSFAMCDYLQDVKYACRNEQIEACVYVTHWEGKSSYHFMAGKINGSSSGIGEPYLKVRETDKTLGLNYLKKAFFQISRKVHFQLDKRTMKATVELIHRGESNHSVSQIPYQEVDCQDYQI